jgi:hypothetical protein
MWGTSLPEDKLAGDLGNVIGATSIGGRRSDFLQQENWRRAIWDFCNNIGTSLQKRCAALCPELAKADVHLTGIRPGEPD